MDINSNYRKLPVRDSGWYKVFTVEYRDESGVIRSAQGECGRESDCVWILSPNPGAKLAGYPIMRWVKLCDRKDVISVTR